MKNPNGFGSVKKLSGNRRRPYAAQVTIGWTDEGKQKQKYIGYFSKRSDAIAALVEYQKDPYDLDTNVITFAEIYEKVYDQHISGQSQSSIGTYRAAFNHCKQIHDVPIVKLKTKDLQDVINDANLGWPTRAKMRMLFGLIYRYAMSNDIVNKDYSKFVEIGKKGPPVIKRKVFTREEIDRLFEVAPSGGAADCVLIMIYTGFRVGELLEIKNKDINFEESYIIGGKKTDAGKNRLVPIHPRILPFIQNRYNPDSEYLIPGVKGGLMPYSTFLQYHFYPLMENLGMDHHTHDCRHTFFTALDNAGANKTAVKKIGGHTSYQMAEKYYTHKDIMELRKAVALLE